MAKKKSSKKSKPSASPKRGTASAKSSKSNKSSKSSKPVKSPKPKARNYKRTFVFKQFRDKYKKTADKDYFKKIEKYWKNEYDKRGRPATVVQSGITKKFVRTIKNRFSETKRPYKGRNKWRKDKQGVWKPGSIVKRYFWKDKLQGDLLRGKKVGARMRKAIEPDMVRGYMRKHGLKNYQKARKRFLKDTKNKGMQNVIWLFGASP